jgi:DNA-binding response OmpR family regulator
MVLIFASRSLAFSSCHPLSRIRALLRRAYGELSVSDANLLYAGDLVIDRGRGQVWRGNQLLNLTSTEFRLLVFLARHPGQALSRAQILDAV